MSTSQKRRKLVPVQWTWAQLTFCPVQIIRLGLSEQDAQRLSKKMILIHICILTCGKYGTFFVSIILISSCTFSERGIPTSNTKRGNCQHTILINLPKKKPRKIEKNFPSARAAYFRFQNCNRFGPETWRLKSIDFRAIISSHEFQYYKHAWPVQINNACAV